MKKMIVRLLVAKMIPVAIGFVTKAFRKKKAAPKKTQQNNEALNNNEAQRLEDNG